MKTIISAIIAFAAFTAAHADPSETLDQCTDYCKATKDGMEYEYCEGDCWKDYHKATGQGQGSSLDILDVMPRLTGETQVAVSDCSVECRFEHEDNYGTCLANCQANQQGSVDGTQTASHCVWGPRGYMCFPSNQQGSLEVMPRLTGETQVAVNDCSVECRFEHEDNYGTCLANCQANQQGSVDGTQTASHCVWGPRGYMCIHQSGANSVEEAPGQVTRFASSVRLGDPQPMCGTDAWACFNGTDDESPAIRDVGIFGIFASNHPCMHPSCD